VDGLAGETASALEHLDRAIALDPHLLDAYRYAGQLRLRAGDFDEALVLSRDLLQRARAEGDPLQEAAALNTMAAASLRLAAYEDAITHYEAALGRQRELGDRQGEWSSLDGLGVAYENLGEHDRARAYHGQALAVAEPLSNRRWTATTLHNIGVTYAQERNMAEARRHYFQALRLRRTLLDRGGQAYTLRDIGMSYLREGQPARARQYLEEAQAAAAAVQDALLHAAIRTMVAETYEEVGAADEARRHYEAALAEAERVRYPELIWRAQRGLGAANEALGRPSEAEGRYAQAIATIEGVRQNVHDEGARTVFLQGRISAYESMVGFLHRRHRQAPDEGRGGQALEYAERAKARTFLELLAEARADLRKGMTAPQREEERRLLRAAAHAQRTLLRASASESQRAASERELAAVEAQLETFERDVRRQSPEYAALRRPEPERLETMQAELLHGSDRLVEFMVGDKSSYAWLVAPGTLKMVALPGRAALERKVARYRALIGRPPTSASVVAEARQSGRALFELLLGPFAAELGRGARLTIVPDGALHYLPFETLVRGVDAAGEPRYLFETADIAYAPSASILVGLTRRARAAAPRLDLLAYGDPQLSATGPSPGTTVRANGYAPLLHAGRELQSIATLFPEDRRRVRTGREATERALKQDDLSRCSILHLATHGHTDAHAPARSGLLFAPGA
jgi:CHAT domain-containing protein/Flp pilus assembly protein TadD